MRRADIHKTERNANDFPVQSCKVFALVSTGESWERDAKIKHKYGSRGTALFTLLTSDLRSLVFMFCFDRLAKPKKGARARVPGRVTICAHHLPRK